MNLKWCPWYLRGLFLMFIGLPCLLFAFCILAWPMFGMLPSIGLVALFTGQPDESVAMIIWLVGSVVWIVVAGAYW